MNHARNFVIFLWLALLASFVRNIGLSDGFAAVFTSFFLLFIAFVLLGVTVLYFSFKGWLKTNTSVEPSAGFLRMRTILRLVPIVPTILFFLFSYNTEYGDYSKTYRDMNPTGTERLMDALGGTLNLTFVFYAIFELMLLVSLWKAKKSQG